MEKVFCNFQTFLVLFVEVNEDFELDQLERRNLRLPVNVIFFEHKLLDQGENFVSLASLELGQNQIVNVLWPCLSLTEVTIHHQLFFKLE